MATKAKNTGKEVAVRNATPPAVKDDTLPAHLQGYKGRTGAENIDSEDVTIPRVKIAQAMTPAVKNGDLEEGALFLNLGNEVLAEPGETMKAVILVQTKEYILWRPREDNGGGILARARPVVVDGEKRYKWDKPQTTFDVKVGGKVKVQWKTGDYIDEDGLKDYGSEIPGDPESGIAATVHHNYIVALPDNGDQLAAVSMSKSQVRKAKDLNALLKRQAQAKNIPIWSLVFNVKSIDDKNTNGDEFKNYEFVNAGYTDAAQTERYTGIADSFLGKVVNVDQSDGEDSPSSKKDARL